MKVFKIIGAFSILCLFFIRCSCKDEHTSGKSKTVNQIKDSTLESLIKKFSLSHLDSLIPDSNSLIFYCSRSFDTSSLVHLQKSENTIHGVFYEILPAYHTYANDYADEKTKLLFFEGYSFVIDSTVWNSVLKQAQIILQRKDSLDRTDRYVDGKTFALYHNFLSRKGDSNNEEVYEKFDRFLKDSFLEKFIQTRKPKLHKIK